MESEKPPQEPLSPTVEIILAHPPSELALVDRAVQAMIEGPVEFVLCDPGMMKSLNRRWRKINRPTDVLTFDLSSPEDDLPAGVVYIDGRLAPPVREVLERVFHGYLHLRGWTHDTPEDADEMNTAVADLVEEALDITGRDLS